MSLEERLSAFLLKTKDADCKNLYIAYSGGIDSHVMLHQLYQLNQKLTHLPLSAIHINHNIHKDSQQWAEHCRQTCETLGVAIEIVDVQAQATEGENQEQKARDCRYQAFESILNKDDFLVTAQHKNDQAETVLMHLLRGSGVDGLCAMPLSRTLGAGTLHRPLLRTSREDIEHYAVQHKLQWVEDPSNDDEDFRRNYLRKSIFPAFDKNWKYSMDAMSKTAERMQDTQLLLSEIAEQDLYACIQETGTQQPYKISIERINRLSKVRRHNLLRHWFSLHQLLKPGKDKLELIEDEIILADVDSIPQLDWQNYSLQRYQNHLYLHPKLDKVDVNWSLHWDGESDIVLGDQSGIISVSAVVGDGLSSTILDQKLTLKLRNGGESCQPSTRNHNRSLKKLFVEYSVPPWLRERWPLLYADDQLVALPGLFVCKGFTVSEKDNGICFNLQESILNLT